MPGLNFVLILDGKISFEKAYIGCLNPTCLTILKIWLLSTLRSVHIAVNYPQRKGQKPSDISFRLFIKIGEIIRTESSFNFLASFAFTEIACQAVNRKQTRFDRTCMALYVRRLFSRLFYVRFRVSFSKQACLG